MLNIMKKLAYQTLLLIGLLLFSFAYATNNKEKVIKIGLVLPIQHNAMTEITNGFTQEISRLYPGDKVVVDVENAMGDVNLLRSILQKFKLSNYDIIVPVGVVATNMAAALIKNKIIISLASDVRSDSSSSCLLHSVFDEIDNKQMLDFIKASYPQLNSLMIVYSNTDKVIPQAKNFISLAVKYGIKVTPVMVNNISDINHNLNATLSGHHPEAMLVLKDTVVVAGISYLINISQKYKIPLIVSDEGSVKTGAGLGLGVREKQIGEMGAGLLQEVLTASNRCNIKNQHLNRLTIFINSNNLFGVSIVKLQTIAQNMQYSIGII